MDQKSDSQTQITSCSHRALCFDASVIGPWVCEKAGGTWVSGRGTAIGQVKDGQLNAGVLYEDFTGANVICHIAGVGNWATRRFLATIFHYPFIQIGAKRITVPIASNNTQSINMVRQMGFTLECVLEQANPDSDILLFRMFAKDCKYLRENYAKHIG